MSQRRTRKPAGDREDMARRLKLLAAAVVVVVLIVLAAAAVRRWSQETAQTQTVSEAAASDSSQQSSESSGSDVAPDNSRYEMDFSEYELKKDGVPAVNQLLGAYFQAKVDVDPEALYRVFGKTAENQEELEERRQQLAYEAKEIEDYQDITCYTLDGLTENSYVVYVTYEVKFRRVDTLAPGLMWCYVVQDGSGNYIIRENVVGDEADYVAKANQSEDVRLLSSQVNQRLREALESDTMLAGACKTLQNGAIVQSSEGADENKDSSVTLVTEPASQEETSQEESAQEETAQTAAAESQGDSQVRLAE